MSHHHLRSILQQLKDCLSRQVAIQYTKDNSKFEYLQNCITRKVVNEEDRDMKEEEREKEDAARII